MATTESVSFDEEDQTLHIDSLSIEDPDVSSYFDGRATEEELARVLRVGVLALQVAETSREMDYVEQAVTEMQHEFEGHVDDFVESIEEQLEENSELLTEELDPYEEGTPTNNLMEELKGRIGDVISHIDQELGREEMRQISPHKGDDFEEQVGKLLTNWVAGPLADVQHTGAVSGALGDSKKGDFVVTTDEGYRLAIEVKDWTSSISKNEMDEYLDEAIRNREADCGLFVLKYATAIPQTEMGWFHEFDPQKGVVVLSEDQDDDINPQFLQFAIDWMSVRARQAQRELDTDVDVDWIDEQLTELKDEIEDSQDLRDQATNIKQAASDLEDDIHELERGLLDRLANIRKEMATG